MHRLLAYCLDWGWVGWRSEMRSGEGFSFICTCIVTSTRTNNRTSTIARTRTNDLTILNTSTSSSDYTSNSAHTSNITVMSKRTRTVSTTGTTIMTSSTTSSSTHTIFRDFGSRSLWACVVRSRAWTALDAHRQQLKIQARVRHDTTLRSN